MAASSAVDVVGHLAEVAHAPAVGLEALTGVVVVGQLGRPVDRDVVVVVEGEQPSQAEVPGQRRRLVRDPLHEAAVAGDHVGAVVADLAAEAWCAASARRSPCRRRCRHPWPSGPVVTSMPAVWPASGCPGVRLPHWRNWRRSSSERSYPVRCSMAYCRMQACPFDRTKRSRSGQLGIARVVVHDRASTARGPAGPAPSRCPSGRSWPARGASMARPRMTLMPSSTSLGSCTTRCRAAPWSNPNRPLRWREPSPTLHRSWLPACRCRQTATRPSA